MPLNPLATTDDVINVMPRDLTADEQTRLPLLLSSASAQVRAFCRRDFTSGTTTVRIKPMGDFVTLPNPPITGITSVKRVNFDGSTTSFAGWAWDGGRRLYGMGWSTTVMVNAPEEWLDNYFYIPLVEVTYTHGSDTVPQVVIDVVVGMVARVFDNTGTPEGLKSQSTGPFSESYATPSPGVSPKLSDVDKQILRDAGFASRGATTVQLG